MEYVLFGLALAGGFVALVGAVELVIAAFREHILWGLGTLFLGIVALVFTAFALPVVIIHGDVDWAPALGLAVGVAAGSVVGAHITVAGGERVVRPVLVVAVLVMAGRLLGLY